MTVKYCMWVPFDMCFSKVRGQMGGRYERTMARPEWWVRRAEIVRDYVVPSFRNFGWKGFDLLVSFMPRHVESGIAQPIIDLYKTLPNATIIAEPAMGMAKPGDMFGATHVYSIAERYYGKCDWVVMMHIDSDDMYRGDMWRYVRQRVTPERGLAIGFGSGYALDIRDGRCWEWLGGMAGQPPYFGYCWPNDALKTYELMRQHAKWARFSFCHERIASCRKKVWLPDKLHCATMSGTNCTKDIRDETNRFLRAHIVRELPAAERDRMLPEFGVRKLLLQEWK